jgi:hypothetical protein
MIAVRTYENLDDKDHDDRINRVALIVKNRILAGSDYEESDFEQHGPHDLRDLRPYNTV